MGARAQRREGRAEETPSIKVAETIATAGASGEKNLAIKWIDIWIGNYKPCYFEVTTRPGHGIEFTIEQLAYKKTYTGTGSLTTQPLPNAPIGTRNTLVARDTTTGEVLEQHGIWYDMSGGGGLSLWAMLKKLLWKG
jgi:hypothetical protein